ncbi:MAG: hypothetical protein ACJ747_02715 [Gaiellaceae bacterium]|jgi:hypothetical protein
MNSNTTTGAAALSSALLGAAALLLPGGGAASVAAAPANTREPVISGTAVQGRTLTTSNGTWAGTPPLTYRYRWLRCGVGGGGVNGVNCATIPGETRRSYVLSAGDVGHRIRSRVIATNTDGTASANSNATAIVKGSARPANTQPPTISGTPTENNTLTANPGSWSGAQPVTYTYEWRRCDQTGGSCSTITGATQRTYTLKGVDVGNTLRVRVTARNGSGSSSTTSAPSAVIQKAGAPGGATVSISEISLPNRLIIDRYAFSPSPLRGRRTIVARFHVSDSRNHNVLGALIFVEPVPLGQTNRPPEQATGQDGWATFVLHPSRAVRRHRSGQVVFFLRARKQGENPLGGVTARRLVGLRLG